jgi:hypothetical protein
MIQGSTGAALQNMPELIECTRLPEHRTRNGTP